MNQSVKIINRVAQYAAVVFVSILISNTEVDAQLESTNSSGSDLEELNVVFARSHFNEMNQSDAVVAIKIWFEKFSKSLDIEMNVNVTSFDSNSTLHGILEAKQADIVILNTKEFLTIPDNLRSTLKPIFSTEIEDAKIQRCYHLLAQQDSDVDDWEDLAGKEVLVLKNYRSHLSLDWLNRSLDDREVPRDSVEVEVVDLIPKAILPVFFGNADACIVGDEAFELMNELNPQIGKRLSPVATSPDFVEVLICLSDSYAGDREHLINNIREFHLDPSGKQVMMLFQISKLIAFEESSLKNNRLLILDNTAP